MSGQLGQPSRLTFRDKVDVCWQKQLRDKHNAEGVPPVPHLDVKRAIVRPVSRELAKQIIYKYEWLGTMAPTSHHYGIFFGLYCAGVVCVGFNAGANLNSSKEFLLESKQLAYLARGANVHWSPTGANSKLVSWTCRLLERDTSAKIIIAYSDSDAGEIGTIYQACNWIYIGIGSKTRQWVADNGRVFDQKLPYDLKRRNGGTRKLWASRLRADGWIEQDSNPKHRYVYVLDKSDRALVDRVEAMRRPYPKRVPRGSGEIDNAADTNPQTGGARPTDPLLGAT